MQVMILPLCKINSLNIKEPLTKDKVKFDITIAVTLWVDLKKSFLTNSYIMIKYLCFNKNRPYDQFMDHSQIKTEKDVNKTKLSKTNI